MNFRVNVIDVFDNDQSLDQCLPKTEEKCLIIIESLPWLLLKTSEGHLCRLLHQWSSKRSSSFFSMIMMI